MSELQAQHNPPTSPFDAIRRVDEDGNPYWTGRDLQPPMQYSQWRDFAAVIEKAKASLALVQGQDEADRNFAEMRKVSGARGPAGADYRLTRFGAYLVAMAGDDTKPAVAEARVYFAVRTREAELGQPRQMSRKELARYWYEAEERAELAEAKVAELKPAATAYQRLIDSDGLIDMTSIADALNMNVRALTRWLVERDIFRKQTSEMNGRNLPRKRYQPEYFEIKWESNGLAIYPVAYATGAGVQMVVDLFQSEQGAA